MADNDSIRARLEALLEQLASGGDKPLGTGGGAEPAGTGAEEPGIGPELEEHMTALQALAEHLSHAAEGADEILTEHPYAAISAAFMLGVAVGRLTSH